MNLRLPSWWSRWTRLSLWHKIALFTAVNLVLTFLIGATAANLWSRLQASNTAVSQSAQIREDVFAAAEGSLGRLAVSSAKLELNAAQSTATATASATDLRENLDVLTYEMRQLASVAQRSVAPGTAAPGAFTDTQQFVTGAKPIIDNIDRQAERAVGLAAAGKVRDAQKVVATELQAQLKAWQALRQQYAGNLSGHLTAFLAERTAAETNRDQLRTSLRNLIVAGALGMAGLNTLMLLWLGFSLTRSLARLTEFTRIAASSGKHDRPVAPNQPIELTALAGAIELMRQKLNSYYADTQEKNQKLESEVSSRQQQNEVLEKTKVAMLSLLEDTKALKATIENERDQLNAVVLSIAEGLVVVDRHLTITSLNPAAEPILGVKAAAVIGKSLDEVCLVYKGEEGGSKKTGGVVASAIKDKRIGFYGLDDEVFIRNEGGRAFAAAVAIAPLMSNDDVTGAVVVFRDITKERESQDFIEEQVQIRTREVAERTKALLEEQARLQASINSLSLGFIMTDAQLEVAIINQAAKKILASCGGLDSKAAAKQAWSLADIARLLGTDMAAQIKECETKRQAVTIDELEVGASFVHMFLAPIIAPNGDVLGAVVVIEDITEAKALNRSRDEFFSIASHELRTPLTAIQGNTSMMLQYYGEQLKDPDLKQMVSDVHDASRRLTTIVSDFLDTSRLEQGQVSFKPEAFDAEKLSTDVVNELKAAGHFKDLSVQIEAPKSLPQLWADKTRTRQILMNVIDNAQRYTKQGSVTVRLVAAGKNVSITVEDTGDGIAPEHQHLLFHKFQQAAASILTRDNTRSTGLGLYIAKLLAEGMGGVIKLDFSHPGKGSSFTVVLPAAPAKSK